MVKKIPKQVKRPEAIRFFHSACKKKSLHVHTLQRGNAIKCLHLNPSSLSIIDHIENITCHCRSFATNPPGITCFILLLVLRHFYRIRLQFTENRHKNMITGVIASMRDGDAVLRAGPQQKYILRFRRTPTLLYVNPTSLCRRSSSSTVATAGASGVELVDDLIDQSAARGGGG